MTRARMAAPMSHMTTSVGVVLSRRRFHIKFFIPGDRFAISKITHCFPISSLSPEDRGRDEMTELYREEMRLDSVRLPERFVWKRQALDILGTRFIDGDSRVSAVTIFVAGEISG